MILKTGYYVSKGLGAVTTLSLSKTPRRVYVVFAVKENSYFHFLCSPASQSEKALVMHFEFKLCRLR